MVRPKGNNKEKKRRREIVGKASWAEVRTKRTGPKKTEGCSWARKKEERYCKNNTFLTLTNTLTPKFCSSSSKTKPKKPRKEKKILTHFRRNYGCT